VHVHQVTDYPEVRVNVDRSKASGVGLTERDVASSLLISLSSSGQVAPNQWLNYVNGVNYQIAVQSPQYRIDSFDALLRTSISSAQAVPAAPLSATSPFTGTAGETNYSVGAAPNASGPNYGTTGTAPPTAQLLSNLATLQRGISTEVANHYDVQPVFDIYANVDRRDLGGIRTDVLKIMKDMQGQLPQATTLDLRGQVQTMQQSFNRLGIGIVLAIVLVYLLMVVNFQSWVDPLIILMALPGALSGVLWMLFVTQTTLSVPSLMGAIMSIGVATANAILIVVFANDERSEKKDEGNDGGEKKDGHGEKKNDRGEKAAEHSHHGEHDEKQGGGGARQETGDKNRKGEKNGNKEKKTTGREAALAAGVTRLRPVCMTALAMILGMLPMSLALGEGGESNAPLGRAVIGGLLVATVTTLFIVPIVYTLLRKDPPVDLDQRIEDELHEGEDHEKDGGEGTVPQPA
jgi:multidrug efflux pump subunit AcrB